MRFILLICYLSLFTNCSNIKPKKSDDLKNEQIVSVSEKAINRYQKNYKTLNIKGKVKEIVCINYIQLVPNAEVGDNNIIKQNYKFNKNGNVVEETCILKDNEFNFRYTYSYDKMNNALITKGFDKNNQPTFIKKDSLNAQGIFMAQKYAEIGHSKVFLDEYEKLTDKERIYTSSTFSNNKKINNSKTRQVFSNGNLVEEYRDIGNNIVIKNTYQYDQNHNKTSHTEYTSDTLTWTME